jgi:hypothetical protein
LEIYFLVFILFFSFFFVGAGNSSNKSTSKTPKETSVIPENSFKNAVQLPQELKTTLFRCKISMGFA